MKLLSEIEIVPVQPKDGLVAFASFTLCGIFRCSSVAIMTRLSGGYRLVYPTKKVGSRVMSIFYPITYKVGSAVEEEVIKKYEEVTKGSHYVGHINPNYRNRRPETPKDNR